MDTRALIELVTLLGGIVTAVAGIVNALKGRRETDAELVAHAGADRVAAARRDVDAAAPDPTYTAQVTQRMADLEGKLREAERILRDKGIVRGKPGPPPHEGPMSPKTGP